MTSIQLPFQPGEIRTRPEIREVLGGSLYGGICPSKEKQAILLFSDYSVGERYGYRDGWLHAEDDLGPIFEYTGAGSLGDQKLTGAFGKGNAAILQHGDAQRALHLFISAGKVPGRQAKRHRYIGAFMLDEATPYVTRPAPDESGAERTVIVFRLRPLAAFHREPADYLPAPQQTQVNFRRRVRLQEPSTWRMRRDKSTSAAIANQRKREALREAFETHPSNVDRDFVTAHVQQARSTIADMCDTYEPATRTVYEVTASVQRKDFQAALGHLLDFIRHLPQADGTPYRLMVLAPSQPEPDIRALLNTYGVGVVYRNEAGGFTEQPSTTAAPSPGSPGGSPCATCPALAR